MARRKKKSNDASQDSIKVIKRYGNRKLYDTQQSRYVTLDEISKMVREGQDLQVVDNKTGEDLTSVTLTQIMLEQEKSKKNVYPLSLLRKLIEQSGESLTEWVQKGKDSFTSMKTEGREQISRILEKGHETRDEGTLLFKEWIASQQRIIDSMQKKIDDRIKFFMGQLTGLEDLEKQVHELEAKIETLEKQLVPEDSD